MPVLLKWGFEIKFDPASAFEIQLNNYTKNKPRVVYELSQYNL